MRCEECGRTLPDDAQFCANCGAQASMGSRAQELVAIARTAGLTGMAGPGSVPPIPEPAELPEATAEAGEYGAGLPEIPEPALLPSEEEQAADLAALTAARETQLSPRAQAAIEQKHREAEAAVRERREAAAALVEQAEREIEERAAAVPQHVSMAQMREERESTAVLPPPPPPPPRPTPEEYEDRMWAETRERMERHRVGVPPAEPAPTRPLHVSIAQVLEARQQEQAERAAETDSTTISGGRCCAAGCIALLIMLFVLALLVVLTRAT